ncbi:MAG: ABC transporter permease subunit [Gammaproteobacteria bacterium]|nr:ABC transporter permease subunit [Gammaproteobacteria bacterium]
MILSIALRELRSLFMSPLAWTVLAVVQFILAWVFFAQIDNFFSLQPQLQTLKSAPGVTDLVVAPLFNITGIVLLMVAPLMTMRLISEERRTGTIQLLMSSPVSMTQIVLGKYLGMMLFFSIFILQISLMPLSLFLGTELDIGKLMAGFLSLFLLISAFVAAGLYLSSLTDNPTIAAVATFGLLLLLWIINASAANDTSGNVFNYISLIQHSNAIIRGVINSTDIIYFVLFICTFLGLSVRQLDSYRLQH